MEKTSPPLPEFLEDATSSLDRTLFRNLPDDEEGLVHYLSIIKRYLPIPNEKSNPLPSEVTLLLIILEEYHELNQLKEKVAWLEQRLLIEITEAPPRFLPP